MPAEIEAKMKVESFEPVRRQLRQHKAKSRGSADETNTFFDTPDAMLRNSDRGLRLRRTRKRPAKSERFVITVKGPQQPGDLKNREETELTVEDGKDATAILIALGFSPTISFQKRRQTWELDGCKIELDEVPVIGKFVEVEGPGERRINRVRKKLGLENLATIKTSYIAMLAEYLQRHGLDGPGAAKRLPKGIRIFRHG